MPNFYKIIIALCVLLVVALLALGAIFLGPLGGTARAESEKQSKGVWVDIGGGMRRFQDPDYTWSLCYQMDALPISCVRY